MNKRDKFAIIKHALSMLTLWKELNDAAVEAGENYDWPKDKSTSWYELRARQAYHDSLISLKFQGLIDGYDCEKVRVSLEGKWYTYDDVPESYRLSFVKKKAISDFYKAVHP